MKAVTTKILREELATRSPQELLKLCVRLANFKKENKELLSYLLFESQDEDQFVRTAKEEIEEQFETINTKSYYFMRKSIRKILTNIKKQIRYSKKKETEVELLLHFCKQLRTMRPSYKRSTRLQSIYKTQLNMAMKAIGKLHEDLQHDYEVELYELMN
ncbi:MAG: hypothetical protein AB8G15_22970 [Saprospiraceae bacterium]